MQGGSECREYARLLLPTSQTSSKHWEVGHVDTQGCSEHLAVCGGPGTTAEPWIHGTMSEMNGPARRSSVWESSRPTCTVHKEPVDQTRRIDKPQRRKPRSTKTISSPATNHLFQNAHERTHASTHATDEWQNPQYYNEASLNLLKMWHSFAYHLTKRV